MGIGAMRGLRATYGLCLLLGFSRAPFQCATRPPSEAAREEGPGEALWNLAEHFGATSNPGARQATLQYLVDRYPTSRFAARARDELGGGARSDVTDDAGGAAP